MIQRYFELKADFLNFIPLLAAGKYYITFMKDAEIVANILDLPLMDKNNEFTGTYTYIEKDQIKTSCDRLTKLGKSIILA